MKEQDKGSTSVLAESVQSGGKKSISVASRKQKGRKLQQHVRDRLIEVFELHKDDVKSTSMGAGGEDIQLSPYARIRIPFSFECKSRARIALYQDYWQAQDNAGGHMPAVVIKQNNAAPLIVMDLEHFLKILKEATK